MKLLVLFILHYMNKRTCQMILETGNWLSYNQYYQYFRIKK